MKILLVAATNAEVILARFNVGNILITGVGMLNTAHHLTKELLAKKYDLVINMGVAGAFNNTLNIGDVVEVIEDNISELGAEDGVEFLNPNQMGLLLETTFKSKGRTSLKQTIAITVNTVHGNETSISKIKERLNPDVESMEGAACFMVCEQFNVPCIQVRAISNRVEKRNKENWNMPLAIKNLNAEVEQIINTL